MSRAGRSGRVLSAAVYWVLCGAGFLSVAAAVRPLVPLPEEYGLSEKFEHFAEHKDEYDVVFVGSSHFWRSIIPEVFDRELALRGHELKSFNFGVGGMRVWECHFLVHRMLALRPAKLKWLFVEGGDWDAGFPSEENTFSSRSVYWHDRAETAEVIAAVWKQEESLLERLWLSFTHLRLWLWRCSNYGQGRAVLADLRGRAAVTFGREREEGAYVAGEGFQTQELLFHPEFKRSLEDFERTVASLEGLNAAEVDLEQLYLGAMERRDTAAAAQGVQIITLIPPGVEGVAEELSLYAAGELDLLFNFNSPDRFPELFRPETRFSPDHLNLTGAREFTHLVARAFVRHLRGEKVE